MKILISIILIVQIASRLFAQDNSDNEELVQVDTIQISSDNNKMIFKYYNLDGGYSFKGGKGSGRFEVYQLGELKPFQSDTLEDLKWAEYEDANFDNILDIKILVMVGMSGDNNVNDYYFYNTKSKMFEYGIGGLSNPSINKEDSTLSSSGYCCMGTMGNDETYKYSNGAFKLIKESGYDREYSYERKLIGDHLVTTDTSWSKSIEDRDGKLVIIDSSWSYIDGKLRIVDVTKKMASEYSQEHSYQEEGEFSADVMGAFIIKAEENFEYSKDNKGILTCSYTLYKARGKELVLVKQSKMLVKD